MKVIMADFMKNEEKSNVRTFKNEQFGQVRVAGTSEQPLFCLADICRSLGLRVDAVQSRLMDAPIRIGVIDSLGREQQMNFVTEKNLYKVIMRSDKPQAEPFQDWVCGEVLPSIRKHGVYMSNEVIERTLTDPDYLIRLATQLKEERQKRMEAEERNKKLTEDNTHKSQVIEGLIYEIPVADMRQRINQIVLKDGSNDIRGKWIMLYDEFDRKYHMKVSKRMINSGYEGTRMDYIDKELHMITELYDLACKLFESSYEQLMESWGKYAKRANKYRTGNR